MISTLQIQKRTSVYMGNIAKSLEISKRPGEIMWFCCIKRRIHMIDPHIFNSMEFNVDLSQWSWSVLSNPQKYQCDSMGLHKFFHHSAIVSCITFHVWKSVDCYFSNKVYRDILRNSYVLTKTLNCLCSLYTLFEK